MILLLDTSTPICKLTLIEGDWRYDNAWEADRRLAKGLLSYLKEQLEKNKKNFEDISGIGVYKGPGSFTGLRIGLTVVDTIADSLGVPIVGETGEQWQQTAIERLNNSQDDQIVLPLYGGEAHITKPRK